MGASHLDAEVRPGRISDRPRGRTPLSTINGVVLDVDDTLYLERDYVRSGFRAVERWACQRLGLAGVGETAWELFKSGRRRTTITDALEALGVTATAQISREAIQAYRDHRPDIHLTQDARDFISSAQAAGIPLGVITDGPVESQRAKCQALGLFETAAVVLLTGEHGRSKPDPWCYEFVADRLTRGPLVYVADNPAKDFVALPGLGWKGVRVRRSGSLHAAHDTPEGVIEVSSLEPVTTAVQSGGLSGLSALFTH